MRVGMGRYRCESSMRDSVSDVLAAVGLNSPAFFLHRIQLLAKPHAFNIIWQRPDQVHEQIDDTLTQQQRRRGKTKDSSEMGEERRRRRRRGECRIRFHTPTAPVVTHIHSEAFMSGHPLHGTDDNDTVWFTRRTRCLQPCDHMMHERWRIDGA